MLQMSLMETFGLLQTYHIIIKSNCSNFCGEFSAPFSKLILPSGKIISSRTKLSEVAILTDDNVNLT